MSEDLSVINKISGVMYSLSLALQNYNQGDKLAAKGDLDYVIDKSRTAIGYILAEIAEENDGKIYK